MNEPYNWDAWIDERIARMQTRGELLEIKLADGRGITIKVADISYWMRTKVNRISQTSEAK